MNIDTIYAAIDLAYEAGKWAGQVDLEEHYDREQFSSAIIETLVAKKTSMPTNKASNGRTVTIDLRSERWRAGVRADSMNYLKIARSLIEDETQSPSIGLYPELSSSEATVG